MASTAHTWLLPEYHHTVSTTCKGEIANVATTSIAAAHDPSSRRAKAARAASARRNGTNAIKVKAIGSKVSRPPASPQAASVTESNTGARCSLNGRSSESRIVWVWMFQIRTTSSPKSEGQARRTACGAAAIPARITASDARPQEGRRGKFGVMMMAPAIVGLERAISGNLS